MDELRKQILRNAATWLELKGAVYARSDSEEEEGRFFWQHNGNLAELDDLADRILAIPAMKERADIQAALTKRLAVYRHKMEEADPFGEGIHNRHELYSFAVECLEYFAAEAGLESGAKSLQSDDCSGETPSKPLVSNPTAETP